MGCDYYTWIETVVEYRDTSGVLMTYIDKPEFEQFKRNYVYDDGCYDPDFEWPPNQLTVDIAYYGKKVLYENEIWLCIESGKQRILTLCYSQNIPIDRLETVYKVMNGYWR
jgi:hypothetical protein